MNNFSQKILYTFIVTTIIGGGLVTTSQAHAQELTADPLLKISHSLLQEGGRQPDTYQIPSERFGAVNVQSVGDYATQEGAKPVDGVAHLAWDVQWVPFHMETYGKQEPTITEKSNLPNTDDEHPFAIYDEDTAYRYDYANPDFSIISIFIPKEAKNIKITGIGADDSGVLMMDNNWDGYNQLSNNFTMPSTPKNVDIDVVYADDFNTVNMTPKDYFDKPEDMTWAEYNDSVNPYSTKELYPFTPRAMVYSAMEKNGGLYPSAPEASNTEYNIIQLGARAQDGVRTIRVEADFEVDEDHDVYVPLRATNERIEDYYGGDWADFSFTRKTPNRQGEYRGQWAQTGPLPEFSITDPDINSRNAAIYSKEENAVAGFAQSDKCLVTNNSQGGDDGSANLSVINTDFDINAAKEFLNNEDMRYFLLREKAYKGTAPIVEWYPENEEQYQELSNRNEYAGQTPSTKEWDSEIRDYVTIPGRHVYLNEIEEALIKEASEFTYGAYNGEEEIADFTNNTAGAFVTSIEDSCDQSAHKIVSANVENEENAVYVTTTESTPSDDPTSVTLIPSDVPTSKPTSKTTTKPTPSVNPINPITETTAPIKDTITSETKTSPVINIPTPQEEKFAKNPVAKPTLNDNYTLAKASQQYSNSKLPTLHGITVDTGGEIKNSIVSKIRHLFA